MAEAGATPLVLVGMMGTGKSTVGEVVAERMGRPFIDTDLVIEIGTGKTVADIFAADGEAAFRELESQVLRDALATTPETVIAAAGGVVLDEANREALRDAAEVVWLRCDPAVLAERVRGSAHRPLLADDPEGVLAEMAVARDALYREVADRVVDTDGLTPGAVADAVLAGRPEESCAAEEHA